MIGLSWPKVSVVFFQCDVHGGDAQPDQMVQRRTGAGEEIHVGGSAKFCAGPGRSVELQADHGLPKAGARAAEACGGLRGGRILLAVAVTPVEECVEQQRAGQLDGKPLGRLDFGLLPVRRRDAPTTSSALFAEGASAAVRGPARRSALAGVRSDRAARAAREPHSPACDSLLPAAKDGPVSL